jgi:TRAP-type C4-dicarboxylate transport system permease small subunit
VNQAAQRALLLLKWIEDGLLAALVLLLVGLAGTQIVLRDFFDSGISWADPLMRNLVLWTGMLGALAAVRDDKHIALDVLQRYLAPLAQKIARIVTLGFAAVICAAMAWYTLGMVRIELDTVTQPGQIPAWLPEAILPFAFTLMALRFALRAFAPPAHIPLLLHDPAAAAPAADGAGPPS